MSRKTWKYFKDKKYCKVRDHCHYIGKYRGAAQNICNLKGGVAKRKPVVFHNGSKYDHHFIIKELAEKIYHLYSSNRKRSYKNL